MSDDYDNPSIRSQVEALGVGETYMRGSRFDPDLITKEVPYNAIRAMRLSMQGTTNRIETRTGYKYTIEAVECRTGSRDIIAGIAVTRMT